MKKQNDEVANEIIKVFSQEFVPAGTVLVNRNGTAKKSLKCSNCGSWIKHWETLSEQDAPSAGDCAVVGCTGRTKDGKLAEIEGCHVMIKDSDVKRVFIAPLCKCCNNKEDGTELKLSRAMILVHANVQETCGKLK
jgi:hypothetical protein